MSSYVLSALKSIHIVVACAERVEQPDAMILLVAHVADIASRNRGECFRWVQNPATGGYPMRCPIPPRWTGVFANTTGERWPVDTCDEHAQGIDDLRPLQPVIRERP